MDIKISSISSFNTSVLSTSLSGIQAPLFQKADSRFPSMAMMGRARIVLPPLLETMLLELAGDPDVDVVSSSFIFRITNTNCFYMRVCYTSYGQIDPTPQQRKLLEKYTFKCFRIPSV